MKKNFKTEIKSPFSYQFKLDEDGLYSLAIRALCKPGWKNKWWLWFKGKLEDILDLHLDDEDLRVEIEGVVFGKPKGKRGLFNSPAAFSGTKTLGKTKTVVFIMHLTKGPHTIKFIPDGSPYLENLEISQILTLTEFVSQFNTRAEDENYYAWYSFVLIDQPLSNLSITAQADVDKEKRDDDDLQIFINGEQQKKSENRHLESYFCGFTARGKEETFIKRLGLSKDTHYIELFADKTPFLKSTSFSLSSERLPQAKVVWDSVNLRQEPNTTSRILAQLSRVDTIEILEKAVQGERPKDESDRVSLSDRWHRISFQGAIGFIFSEALEIESESEEEIKKLIQETASGLKADPLLMLALAEVESSLFPYRVSLSNAYGAFQITQSAIDDLNENDKYNFIVTDPFALEQNIEAGIRYFQKLYEKYFKDILAGRVEISLAGYNMGPTDLPKQGIFNLKTVPQDVQAYVSRILIRYEFYKKQGGFSRQALLVSGSIFLLLIALLASKLFLQFSSVPVLEEVQQAQEEYEFAGGLVEPGSWEFMLDVDHDGEKESVRVTQQKKRDVFLYFETTASFIDHGEKRLIVKHKGGPLTWIKLVNLDQYGPPEFLFETLEGKLAYTRFYQYQTGTFVSIPVVPAKDVLHDPGFFGRNGIGLWDTQGKIMVVLHKDQFMEKKCPGETELYSYYDSKLIKAYNLCTAPERSKEFKGYIQKNSKDKDRALRVAGPSPLVVKTTNSKPDLCLIIGKGDFQKI